MLIKSHRFHLSTISEDDKMSSISTDFPNEIYNFKPQSFISNDYFPTFIHELVPQTNLSPRFYRQYQGVNERQRQPPSLSYINHRLLPTITHLKNGDVLITA